MNIKKYIIWFVAIIISTFVQAQNLKPDDLNAIVEFHVMDYEFVAEQNAEVLVFDKDSSMIAKGISDVEGVFKTMLKEGHQYKVLVKKFGKVFDFVVDVPTTFGPLIFEQKLKIRVIQKFKRIYTLENVYFDVDKYILRSESFKSIDKLYNEMNKNPKMKVELAGHTDSDGDDHKNMVLSQNRANAVKEYLVSRGIKEGRILSKGYGETSPIAPNDTPENKQRNRRTEVRVIEE